MLGEGGVYEIKPRLALYKARALPTVLSSPPPYVLKSPGLLSSYTHFSFSLVFIFGPQSGCSKFTLCSVLGTLLQSQGDHMVCWGFNLDQGKQWESNPGLSRVGYMQGKHLSAVPSL